MSPRHPIAQEAYASRCQNVPRSPWDLAIERILINPVIAAVDQQEILAFQLVQGDFELLAISRAAEGQMLIVQLLDGDLAREPAGWVVT